MTRTPDTPSPRPDPPEAQAFAILADGNPAGIVVHRDHLPLYVNAAWASVHGTTVDAVMAMPDLLPFLAPPERERIRRQGSDRLPGEEAPTRYSYEALHDDGSRMWVDVLAKRVTWLGEPAVMDTLVRVDMERDATRIEAVARAHRDHQLFLAVLSQVQDRISIIGRDLTYRFTNQRNLDIYGLEPSQIIGRHMRDIIGEERFARALPMFERCLRGEDINYQHGKGGPGTDGGWVDVSLRPFRPDGDAIEGVVVTLRDITALHDAQESTRHSETRLKSVIANMPGPVFLKDREGRFQIINRAFEENIGKKARHVIGRTVLDIVESEERHRAHAHDLEVLRTRSPSDREREEVIDGETRTFITSKFPVFDEAGNVEGVGGVEIDITERKRTAIALEESERRLFNLMSNLPGMAYRNRLHADDVRTEFVSEGCRDLLGYDPSEVCGTEGFMAGITHPDDRERVRATLARARDEHGRFEMRYRVVTAGGEVRWVWEQGFVMPVSGESDVIEGFITDVSESQRLSERLSHQARHDPLTDLLNRRAFEERLQAAVRRARETGDESALVFLDLDRFKAVNDSCGHAAGDELLRQLTARMHRTIRRQDTLARLGGDEFGLLMDDCSAEQAKRVALELQRTVRDFRFRWQARTFSVGVSIGLVPVTAAMGDAGEIMVAADNACYVAKESGRDRVHVYRHGDREVDRLSGQSVWIPRIEDALEHDRLVLHAQPIEPLTAAPAAGLHCEVLLRMQGDDGVLVPPSAFLPAAERFGLSTAIDRWVVRRALGHLARSDTPHRLSVNLSARSLSDDAFLEFVSGSFEKFGVAADRVCLEITETAAIGNIEAATRFIDSLRRRGCLFSLDDFGRGLSSFAYLKTLPVDFLKIDGLFVRDVATDPIDLALVRSINDIGKVMGKQTIAEFVENDAILERLRELGVDHAQGFGIARPRPLDDYASDATPPA